MNMIKVPTKIRWEPVLTSGCWVDDEGRQVFVRRKAFLASQNDQVYLVDMVCADVGGPHAPIFINCQTMAPEQINGFITLLEDAAWPDWKYGVEDSSTDLMHFLVLFHSVGLEYDLIQGEELMKRTTMAETASGTVITLYGGEFTVHSVVKIKEGKHARVVGFPRFFTCFYFDIDGKFIATGIWE